MGFWPLAMRKFLSLPGHIDRSRNSSETKNLLMDHRMHPRVLLRLSSFVKIHIIQYARMQYLNNCFVSNLILGLIDSVRSNN